MFTRPAANRGGASKPSGMGRGVKLGRYQSKVKKLPEMFGLPVATLADEILDGDVRGLVSLAGNPALSAPNGARWNEHRATLERARSERSVSGLDRTIAVDFDEREPAA